MLSVSNNRMIEGLYLTAFKFITAKYGYFYHNAFCSHFLFLVIREDCIILHLVINISSWSFQNFFFNDVCLETVTSFLFFFYLKKWYILCKNHILPFQTVQSNNEMSRNLQYFKFLNAESRRSRYTLYLILLMKILKWSNV